MKADIILCGYNCENCIEQTLNSFFTCLGPDLRLIYIDDGSTDKSLSIVSQVLDAKKDYCTIISFTKNRGLTIRLKRAVEQSCADLIFRVDADDECMQDRFDIQKDYMERNTHVDILGAQARLHRGDGTYINISNKPLGPKLIARSLYLNPFIHSSVVFRRESLLKVGNYNESIKYGQDYELWFRSCELGLHLENLPDILVNHRLPEFGKYNVHTYYREFLVGLKGLIRTRGPLIGYILITCRLLKGIASRYYFNIISKIPILSPIQHT